VYGLRNTFGFTFDRRSKALWLQTNGQAAYDEIGRYEGGDNLGWIQLMGPPDRVASYKDMEQHTDRLLDSPAYPPRMLADSREAGMGPPAHAAGREVPRTALLVALRDRSHRHRVHR
jgi:glucose/arabinose dehydrogenase